MPESRVFGADEVARKEFATSFRGFDQHEVRSFLGRLAAELASLQTRERSLEERLAQADARAIPRELGEDELENALGLETTKVLHAAREAATEIRSRAEEQVARLLREASDDSTRMREEAATVLADRSADAERAAAAIRTETERAAHATRAEAAASAEATIESAKEQGRQMVGEAQAVRERILRDLGRRRRAAQQQLEQLRAGRERLLEACRGVQAALDAATTELVVSEPEARAAAETAGLRAASEPEMSLEELEAEVAAAVDAGLVVRRPTRAALADPDASVGVDVPDEPSAPDSRGDGPPAHEPTSDPPPAAEVEPAAPPAAELPVGAAPGDVGLQRGASPLTLVGVEPPQPEVWGPGLRRRKRKGGPVTVGVVDLGDASEGVRLLPTAGSQTAESASVAEPVANDALARGGTGPADPAEGPPGSPDGEVGAVGDEIADASATPVGEPPPADDSSAATAGVQGGADRRRTSTTVIARTPPTVTSGDAPPSGPADPAPDGAPSSEGDGGDGGDEQPKAGDVFARMRAERAAEVSRANVVLADGTGGRSAPAVGAPAFDTGGAVAADPEIGDDEEATATASAFEQRDGDVEAHERALVRALKRALGDEQNQLLDDLRQAKGVPSVDQLLPSSGEQAARYATAATSSLSAAAAAGGGADVPDADVAAMAAALGGDLVEGLRPRLARSVEGAGGDEATATEALSSAYREWKTSRIEPLARHHVLASWAAGAFASTPDVALRWVVDPEVGCSPDCADNVLAGPTAKGEAFPTGQPHPPAHVGCRCLLLPGSR